MNLSARKVSIKLIIASVLAAAGLVWILSSDMFPTTVEAPVSQYPSGHDRLHIATDENRWASTGLRPQSDSGAVAAKAISELDAARRLNASLPLNLIFDDLSALAAQGDVEASCRLARDLGLCSRAGELGNLMDAMIDAAATSGEQSVEEAASVAQISELATESSRATAICAGLTEEQRAQSDIRNFQAAQLGDRDAMVRFVLMPRFAENRDFSTSDLMVQYQEHALEMLERAAALGQSRALAGLFQAYSEGFISSEYGILPIQRDPTRAVAAGMALLDNASPHEKRDIEETLALLNSEIGAGAQARVQEQFAEFGLASARGADQYHTGTSMLISNSDCSRGRVAGQ